MGSSKSTTFSHLRKETLKKVLGVFDLFAVGFGDLGSSIFYALGVTALFSLGATPISLGLAGFVFICTALSYAELCSMFHESGGSASFARKAFNDLVSFIAGWGLLLDYIVTIAISSFAVGPYLAYFFLSLEDPKIQISFAIGLIAFLFLLNAFGVKQSTKISIVLTFGALAVEAVVIGLGCYYLLDVVTIEHHMRIGDPSVPESPSWTDFWKGTAMAMVAYTGIESIAQLGSESRRPAKIVPKAILMTMLVLVVIYVGISLVALSAVSPVELGTKYVLNPIIAIIQALPVGVSILAPAGALIAAGILAAAANAGLIGSSRLSFNMGEYYQLPRLFYQVNSRFRTPTLSLAFFSILACGIIVASQGQMDFLADLYNFGAMLAFLSTHLSLIVLRIKHPHAKRPFKIPGNISFRGAQIPISAIIGAFATFGVWCLVVITKPAGRYLGVAWMIAGLVMYLFYRKSQKIHAGGSLEIEHIEIPGYKPTKVKKILLPIFDKMPLSSIEMACSLAKQHQAEMAVIYVLDIHASLPLDSLMPRRTAIASCLLKAVEAICREKHIKAHYELIRARSLPGTILDRLDAGKYDLLILSQKFQPREKVSPGFDRMVDKIVRGSSCRVLVTKGSSEKDPLLVATCS